MPLFDFKCPTCGDVKELRFSTYEQAKQCHMWCARCGTDNPMERQVAAPNFTISGYTAANGYSEEK